MWNLFPKKVKPDKPTDDSLLRCGRQMQDSLQTLEFLDPYFGARIVRLGIYRWPNFDWDVNAADGDLIITLQQEHELTNLRIEAHHNTPGGVSAQVVPADTDWLVFRSLAEARERYDREQTEDEDGNVEGSQPQVIDLATYEEFSSYTGASLERISLACSRRRGSDLLPFGMLLELSEGLQLYVTIGEDTTEVYRSLTRKYEIDGLVMLSIDSGTKELPDGSLKEDEKARDSDDDTVEIVRWQK